MAALPFRERLTCTIDVASEATGIGRSKLYEMMDRGEIATVKHERQRLIKVRSLVALLDPPDTAAAAPLENPA